MPWVKGQSGNPKGRPRKERALTAILERTGRTGVEVDGKRVSRQRLLAQRIWEVLTYKRLTIDGFPWPVPIEEWLMAVRWLYAHTDGAPKQDISLETRGPIPVEFVNDWRQVADTPPGGAPGDPQTEADQL